MIIKSYTDLEQSKKLVEFLPLESVDCYWDYDEMQKFHRISWFEDGYNKESQLILNENNVCAWSLAALVGVLPDTITSNDGIAFKLNIKKNIIEYSNPSLYLIYKSVKSDNIVDACYEMIIKLHELNLL